MTHDFVYCLMNSRVYAYNRVKLVIANYGSVFMPMKYFFKNSLSISSFLIPITSCFIGLHRQLRSSCGRYYLLLRQTDVSGCRLASHDFGWRPRPSLQSVCHGSRCDWRVPPTSRLPLSTDGWHNARCWPPRTDRQIPGEVLFLPLKIRNQWVCYDVDYSYYVMFSLNWFIARSGDELSSWNFRHQMPSLEEKYCMDNRQNVSKLN